MEIDESHRKGYTELHKCCCLNSETAKTFVKGNRLIKLSLSELLNGLFHKGRVQRSCHSKKLKGCFVFKATRRIVTR